MGVLDMFNLKGKIAVVTGSAGKYGRQVAAAVAEAGAKTFIASRSIDTLEKQAESFREDGYDVSARHLDQADESSVKALLASVIEAAGGVDILVNNAVLRPMKAWDDPIENFAKSMEVNLTGMFLMCREFGNHMAARGGGSIVNIGSIQGIVGPDYSLYEELGWTVPPDYFTHKGGMQNLTRFAAAHLGPNNVRVNTVNAGGYDSGLPEEFLSKYNKRTFLGRMANDTDLQGIIVFLASDASTYVTGADIAVDGGYTAK